MELMVVVAVIGLLMVVAITQYVKHVKRSKTSEAVLNIRRLTDAEMSYYAAEHAAHDGLILAKQFAVHDTWSPAQGTCCALTGLKCPANPSLWTDEGWHALNFSIDDPHYYSYQVYQTGNGDQAGDMTTVQASGDLNCNGVYSLFSRTVTVQSDFTLRGGSGLYMVNELE